LGVVGLVLTIPEGWETAQFECLSSGREPRAPLD